ncbi:MAG: hypothetical protein KA885_06600 [Spirochaetes bacterium]|nr:hypothetical protein [Spirochaetota bacterium]
MICCAPGTVQNGGNTIEESSTYRVYFYKFDGNYSGYGLYVWNDSSFQPSPWPGLGSFTGVETINNIKFVYKEFTGPTNVATAGLKFIINWSGGQTADLVWPNPVVNKKIYLIDGFWSSIYTDGILASENTVNDILAASITSTTEISLSTIIGITANDIFKLFENDVEVNVTKNMAIDSKTGKIALSTGAFNFEKEYKIQFNDRPKQNLFASNNLIDNSSTLTPAISETLGIDFSGAIPVFKVWSPFATKVVLNIYSTWNQANDSPDSANDMIKGTGGVWSKELSGVEGKYYQYEIHYGTKIYRCLDPYAKSMAQFSENPLVSPDQVGKGAVINPSLHNPTGWVSGAYAHYTDPNANIYGYNSRKDAIIYEIHVRDFTSSPDITTTAPFGTYKSFIEKLDHIKNLGVTHVQLLPVLSYYYGDESKRTTREDEYSYKSNNYNWGYDPHNYFSPEGMYSTNPNDPTLRIKELKELIKAIHDAGMGVILDVVYNHTAKRDILEYFAPEGYFYRKKDGNFTNKSGCGNDTESTNKMMRKIIIDSLEYWTKEYCVDGFRFDLMGIVDNRTIANGYTRASALNSKTLFVAEGWYPMFDGPSKDYEGIGVVGADIAWMKASSSPSAAFSDYFRDFMKSGGFDEGKPGYITGVSRLPSKFIKTVKGSIISKDGLHISQSPDNVLLYMTAHDGFTLYDTVAFSKDLSNDDEIFNRMKLGYAMMLTSQGVAFIHAGDEMGRSKEYKGDPTLEGWTSTNYDVRYVESSGKYFVRNSYDSSDAINKIDWNLAYKDGALDNTKNGAKLYNYVKGLIQLRKSTNAFKLGSYTTIDNNVSLVYPVSGDSYSLTFGYKNVDTSGNIYLIYLNASNNEVDINTFDVSNDINGAKLIVDRDNVNTSGILNSNFVDISSDFTGITLQPLTTAIFKK